MLECRVRNPSFPVYFGVHGIEPAMTGEKKPLPLRKTKFAELNASVSPDGGREPFWRGDGKELFYRAPNASLMAVPIEKGPTFAAGTPQALFRARFAPVTARGLYRPTPDGQRFLVLAPLGRDAMQPATVVMNWTAALP
jgi:hypothetical protein